MVLLLNMCLKTVFYLLYFALFLSKIHPEYQGKKDQRMHNFDHNK